MLAASLSRSPSAPDDFCLYNMQVTCYERCAATTETKVCIQERVKLENISNMHLSDPARSTKLRRPNRIFVMESRSHCRHTVVNIPREIWAHRYSQN